MKALVQAPPSVLLCALAFGIAGCVSPLGFELPYTYTQHGDSATLSGPLAPASGVSVSIAEIDRFGLNAAQRGSPDKYVSPGTHGIGLYAWSVDDAYNVSDWSGEVSAAFSAGHRYRLTSSMNETVFEIGLLDDGTGVGKSLFLGDWPFIAQMHDENGDGVDEVDFGGVRIARPSTGVNKPQPSHPGKPLPPHQGGIPPIPHNPRPPGGGGILTGAGAAMAEVVEEEAVVAEKRSDCPTGSHSQPAALVSAAMASGAPAVRGARDNRQRNSRRHRSDSYC